jgi:hypothetical protein
MEERFFEYALREENSSLLFNKAAAARGVIIDNIYYDMYMWVTFQVLGLFRSLMYWYNDVGCIVVYYDNIYHVIYEPDSKLHECHLWNYENSNRKIHPAVWLRKMKEESWT